MHKLYMYSFYDSSKLYYIRIVIDEMLECVIRHWCDCAFCWVGLGFMLATSITSLQEKKHHLQWSHCSWSFSKSQLAKVVYSRLSVLRTHVCMIGNYIV